METDSTQTSIIQVLGANATAIGITLTNINEVLTTLSLALAICYTIYKFSKDLKGKK